MNRVTKSIIFCSTLLLLSSCGIYGSYERPKEITASAIYRSPESPTDTIEATNQNMGDVSWRNFFSDPYLQDLIEKGLERNADLRTAKLTLEQAKAGLLSSKLGFLPNVSTAPMISYGSVSEQWGYKIPVDVSWEVDLFGRLRNGYKGRVHAVQQAEAYTQLVQTNVVAAIANSYYMLLMLDRQRSITEESRALFDETVRIMRVLKDAGVVNEAAVAQAEASTFNVMESLVMIDTQIRSTENALALLLHLPAQQIPRGTLDQYMLEPDVSLGIPVDILSYRPDVKLAEERLSVAYYGTNAARSAFLPGVRLMWNGSWANALGETVANPASFVWNAIASIFQPIFNNGKNVAALRVAKAQQEQAAIEYQQAILAAGAEVSNFLFAYNSFSSKLEYRAKQIQSLQRATDASMKLVKLGSSNYLEVITAQNQLLVAQLGACKDQFEQTQALINLYKSLGGGRF